MYYIGYTSCISGGDDTRIFEYVNWCYGAEDDEDDVVDYPLGFFFSGNSNDENYILKTSQDQTHRQLFAQYPTEDVLNRCAVMMFFDDNANAKMNQMWINVRCFNIKSIPFYIWVIIAGAILLIVILVVILRHKSKNYEPKSPRGYQKV
jgi:spermidine/putrescine transport system substrate-binding protein